MMGLWLLLPALAGYVSAEPKDGNFVKSCSEIELDQNRGLLNAFCPSKSSTTADHVSQVDLNGCLGWGPSDDSKNTRFLKHNLFPATDGNFSQYCSSCHIIQEGESATQVGYILCNCAPKDSEIELEYIYDLKKIVEVDSNGCLQCAKAPSMCSQVKQQELPAPLEDKPRIPPSTIPRLVDGQLLSFAYANSTNVTGCDIFITKALKRYPNAIPKTFQAHLIRPCAPERGLGLCCYPTLGGFGRVTHGFHLIEAHKYIYRIEYGEDDDGNYTVLEMVSRFCKYPESPEMCPGGDPDVDVGPTGPDPRFPKPTNTPTSSTWSTNSPRLSTRPTSSAMLDRRGIRSSTTSRNVTGIPDIYFPTPTLTRSKQSPSRLAGYSPAASPELKIDFGNLDAPGLVDIMLAATNIEEVRHAHLDLTVSTDCYTNEDGKVNCNKVVVALKGNTIGQDSEDKSGCLIAPPAFWSRTVSTTKTATAIPIVPTTPTITASTTTIGRGTALSTGLLKRLDMSLPCASTPTTPLPRFEDKAQAVLGPRDVTFMEELQGPVLSVMEFKSKTTSEKKSKSKSKMPEKTKTTKTKTNKVTKTKLMPTTRTVTDTRNTFTMTQTQTIPGNATETMVPGLLQRSQSLKTDNDGSITNTAISTVATGEGPEGLVLTTMAGSAPEPSVIVMYITEEKPLVEDANRSPATQTSSI